MSQAPTLSNLSKELKRIIASNLGTHDVRSFSMAGKSIHSDLALSTATPSFRFNCQEQWYGLNDTGDAPRCYRPIPILFPGRTHSIRIQCDWRDQGWGNRRGRLYILAHNKNTVPGNRTFANGASVVISPLAEHFETKCTLCFSPHADLVYTTWFSVGGGRIHKLSVRNITVTALIFDNTDQSLSKAHTFLGTTGVLEYPFPNEFLIASILSTALSLLTQMERNRQASLDPNLSDLLESRGFQIERNTLVALSELAKIIQGLRLEKIQDDPARRSFFIDEILDDVGAREVNDLVRHGAGVEALIELVDSDDDDEEDHIIEVGMALAGGF